MSKWFAEARHWNNAHQVKAIRAIAAIDFDASGESQVSWFLLKESADLAQIVL